ncbi:MAG: SDR family NAD(P)-dependent oxidoreductase, partial [Pseudonocardia sp.]
LLGSVGQGNYSAAKAGIVGLTLVASAELARYGVTVNAIAPAARTAGSRGRRNTLILRSCDDHGVVGGDCAGAR